MRAHDCMQATLACAANACNAHARQPMRRRWHIGKKGGQRCDEDVGAWLMRVQLPDVNLMAMGMHAKQGFPGFGR